MRGNNGALILENPTMEHTELRRLARNVAAMLSKDPDEELDQQQVMTLLGFGRTKLHLERHKDFPEPIRIVLGRPRWLRRDVVAWDDRRKERERQESNA